MIDSRVTTMIGAVARITLCLAFKFTLQRFSFRYWDIKMCNLYIKNNNYIRIIIIIA